MATAGPNVPNVGEAVTSGDANEVTWTTPGNITTNDSATASVTAATFDSPDPTFYLVGRQFSFSIPANSTIDGITVVVNCRSIITNSGKTRLIRLRDANGAEIGDDKNDIGSIWGTTLADRTYGGPTDTWNTGLSAANLLAMVNDVDFGVFIQAQANIANADLEVEHVTITIDYTPPVTVTPPVFATHARAIV